MATPPVAPGFQNQQVGGFERIERMPAPPPPMQPRPSLVVGGPAFFTPEGYQAPVQPEQAFMPTDRRPDPIGDNFRRPYERPIMPMPMPRPIDVPQDRAPVVPIEQPRETLPVDPGPVRPMPMPMPIPEPQPKYDPFAYSDLGRRALGGEYIDSMTFYYFDPTTGKSGSTTKGYSRVPDSAKPYIYLNKEEADRARDKFLEYEDTGGAETPAQIRTPVTAPIPTISAPSDVTALPKLEFVPRNTSQIHKDLFLMRGRPAYDLSIDGEVQSETRGIQPTISAPPVVPQIPQLPVLPPTLQPSETISPIGLRLSNVTVSPSSRTLPGSKENLIRLRDQR